MNFGDGRLRNEEMAKRIHFYGTDKKTSREKSERVNDRTLTMNNQKIYFFPFSFFTSSTCDAYSIDSKQTQAHSH